MFIQRIQVDEGFLDGLDVTLGPGLNVIIGARGTGKTSLIELMRFCLGVKGYTPDSDRRSKEHALSVLGGGQVTVTLSVNGGELAVSRTAADPTPRSRTAFPSVFILSQTEIESVGLAASGRLRLLDSFNNSRLDYGAVEGEAASMVRSLTAEADALQQEVDQLNEKTSELPKLLERLQVVATQQEDMGKVSEEASKKRTLLECVSNEISSSSVALAALERFSDSLGRWLSVVSSAVRVAPKVEDWPEKAGEDMLADQREGIARAVAYIQRGLEELTRLTSMTEATKSRLTDHRVGIDERARALRKQVEEFQVGAGKVAREEQVLREDIARQESLKLVLEERRARLNSVLTARGQALDRLDHIRESRFAERHSVAEQLNAVLGPQIRVSVLRSGVSDRFAAEISSALKGSGLHYRELSSILAKRVSPRELLEATDTSNCRLIEEAVGISPDRASRVLAHLRQADLGSISTVEIDDLVKFELLDGVDFKDIGTLSTGQRCTVILPLVLRHTRRVIVVDQPEDHIDNAFIVETLIRAIRKRDPGSQMILSTHNANIPVLGEADLVIQLASDGRRGFLKHAAELDDVNIVGAITSLMEGGAEAFNTRATFYESKKS